MPLPCIAGPGNRYYPSAGDSSIVDSFNRADAANLGPNWGTPSGASTFTIDGNQGTVGGFPGSNYFSGADAPDNGYSEVVLGSAVETHADNGVGPAYRMATDAITMYFAQCNAVDIRLYKAIAGSFTQLGIFTASPACAMGDLVRITLIGTAISVQKNGTTIIGPITDASIASGFAGVWGSPSAINGQIDSFAFSASP